MKKQVIYSDLDGTLLNYENRKSFIGNKNVDAINKWIGKNNFFSIATGRNIGSVSRFFEDNHITIPYNLPMVLSNGTVVYDYQNKKIIYQEIFNKQYILESIEYVEKNDNALLVLLTPDKHYILEPKKETNLKLPNFNYTLVKKDEIKYDEITKISFIVSMANQEKLLKDLTLFKSFDQVELIPSSPTYIELVNKGTSKFEGIKKALQYANINDYNIYTIGDYLNDYDMIKRADLGFAPENAHEDVKSVADHKVSHHNNGAVAEMIMMLETKIK